METYYVADQKTEIKTYYVADQWSHEIIEAISPRKACEEFIRSMTMADKPSLRKIYVDNKDNTKTFHVGYVYGQHWMSVGEINFLSVKQKALEAFAKGSLV